MTINNKTIPFLVKMTLRDFQKIMDVTKSEDLDDIFNGLDNTLKVIAALGDVTFEDFDNAYYIFNAKLGRITASNYVGSKYVINSSSMVSFMANKSNFCKVNNIKC